jgi:60 kDa SS-A/Ro ribonucleoprotein
MDYTKTKGVAKRTRAGTLTPQSEPIPGSTQVSNNAGGFAWDVSDAARFDRFLMLGAESGTYYVGHDVVVKESSVATEACIKADGRRTVERIVEVSEKGLAPKRDPALFALALAASIGDDTTRYLALLALPQVARTGTDLMHFARFADAFRGRGRGIRNAYARWFTQKKPRDLAYQLIKYQSRDGWALADVLRIAHPKADDTSAHALLYRFAATGFDDVQQKEKVKLGARVRSALCEDREIVDYLNAFDTLRKTTDVAFAARIIRTYRFPREAVPTPLLNERPVLEALAEDMPMHALVRNLGVLTANGLIAPGSEWTVRLAARLRDKERVTKSRLHPIALLSAAKVYAGGAGIRGQKTWAPVPQIIDALNDAFYLAFGAVTPVGKRMLVGLDCSGSMNQMCVGMNHLSTREAAGAFGLVHAATEPAATIVEFGATTYDSARYAFGYGDARDYMDTWNPDAPDSGVRLSTISARQRLDDVIRGMKDMGGTDLAMPVRYALAKKIAVDVFVIYTDNETWAGKGHPAEWLAKYRKEMNIPAKLVCVSMAANNVTVVDPKDTLSLGIAGLDTSVPNLIAGFAQA